MKQQVRFITDKIIHSKSSSFKLIILVFLVLIIFIVGCNMRFFTPKKTFKSKTQVFWTAFIKQQESFKLMFDNNNINDLDNELSNMLKDYMPGLYYHVGFNKKLNKYELTLSPHENKDYQILSRYWLENSPKLNDWIFYNYNQPCDLTNISLSMFEQKINTEDFLLTVNDDNTKKKIDILAFHSSFDKLSSEDQQTITYTLLNEALGEYGLELWINSVETTTICPKENFISIVNLKKHLDLIISNNHWDSQVAPDEVWYGYSLEVEKKNHYEPREDIIAGGTTHLQLVNGNVDQYFIQNTGAEYIFLMIENSNDDLDIVNHLKNVIADSLDIYLKELKQGYVIGGATGIQYFYIDLIIFDDKQSKKSITQFLKNKYPKIKYTIHDFSK